MKIPANGFGQGIMVPSLHSVGIKYCFGFLFLGHKENLGNLSLDSGSALGVPE